VDGLAFHLELEVVEALVLDADLVPVQLVSGDGEGYLGDDVAASVVAELVVDLNLAGADAQCLLLHGDARFVLHDDAAGGDGGGSVVGFGRGAEGCEEHGREGR
jgi:hypothetical protein